MTKNEIIQKTLKYYEKELQKYGQLAQYNYSDYDRAIIDEEISKCVFVLETLSHIETDEEIDDFLNDFEGLVKEALGTTGAIYTNYIYTELSTEEKKKYIQNLYRQLYRDIVDIKISMYEYEADMNCDDIDYKVLQNQLLVYTEAIESLSKVRTIEEADAFVKANESFSSYSFQIK